MDLNAIRIDVSWGDEGWDVECVRCGWSAEIEIIRPTVAQLVEQVAAHDCRGPRR